MGRIAITQPGEVFGRLTVLAREGALPDGTVKYRCKCRCGNEHVVAGTVLRQGVSRSCGCLVRENKGVLKWDDPEQAAFQATVRAYQCQARRRNLVWALSEQDCWTIFKSPCFYCGDVEMNTASYKRKNYPPRVLRYNGIDRCDPLQGYERDNVVPCCFVDNRAKNNMTMAEYTAWLARLIAHQNRVS